MLKLTKTLGIGLCATMLMFSCSKDMEDVNPSSTLSGVSTDAKKPGTLETNSFDFAGITTSDGGKTWSFTVKRSGDNKGANANIAVLGLVGCGGLPISLTETNVASLSVTKEGEAAQILDLSFADNSNNACSMTATPNYVSFAEFKGNVKDGSVYTFTLVLKEAVQVTKAYAGIRAGADCFLSGEMNGPGCEENLDTCGKGQGAFHKAGSWQNKTVTLGGYTYTEAQGIALMNPNANSGNKYISFAFSQGATVELNKQLGLISATAYNSEMAAINTYLAGLGSRLTITSAAAEYDKNDEAAIAAKNAAGYIGANIDCED